MKNNKTVSSDSKSTSTRPIGKISPDIISKSLRPAAPAPKPTPKPTPGSKSKK